MHERVELEFAEIAVIHIHIAIYFFKVNPETVGVVVYQVHGQDRLIEPYIFNFEILHIAVIKSLRRRAGGQ